MGIELFAGFAENAPAQGVHRLPELLIAGGQLGNLRAERGDFFEQELFFVWRHLRCV